MSKLGDAELAKIRTENACLRAAAQEASAILTAIALWLTLGLSSTTFPKTGRAILDNVNRGVRELNAALVSYDVGGEPKG